MTVEELRALMVQMNPDETDPIDDETLIWFVCIQEAGAVCDYSLKDIAGMFRNGIEALNSLEDVQNYLDLCFEDVEEGDDESRNEVNQMIIDSVQRFLGKKEPVEE